MSKMKLKTVALISVCLLFAQSTVVAQFDPALKTALDTVTGQRDRTTRLISDSRQRARSIENNAFPGRLPSSVPEFPFCQDVSSGRFDDMRVAYNNVLDSIRNGSATENTVRSSARTSVTINNSLIDSARKCLVRNSIMDFTEASIADAWMKIFTSFQGMNENDKKKLSKHLDKKVRWKTTR
jgi:hypothetical protein